MTIIYPKSEMERTLDGARRMKLIHFRNRLLERMGITVTDDWISSEILKIDSYENKPAHVFSSGRSIHFVVSDDIEFAVIFDWAVMCFCTAFHRSWVGDDGSLKRRNRKRKAKDRPKESKKRTRGSKRQLRYVNLEDID